MQIFLAGHFVLELKNIFATAPAGRAKLKQTHTSQRLAATLPDKTFQNIQT
jgi:hypothetical protein